MLPLAATSAALLFGFIFGFWKGYRRGFRAGVLATEEAILDASEERSVVDLARTLGVTPEELLRVFKESFRRLDERQEVVH